MNRSSFGHSLVSIGLSLSLVVLIGCGGGTSTYELSGTVKYEGKPVPKGNITIYPDDGNPGLGAVAEIVNGKFSTPPGKGHTGGKYKLVVNGYDGVPVKSGEGDMDPLGKPLFPTYQMFADLPEGSKSLEINVVKQGTE